MERIPIHTTVVFSIACAWGALLLAPPRCAAEPSAAERETARTLMDEGDRLRSAGDLRAALTRYHAAHALMHVPTTGLDLARVQSQLGLLVEARGTASEVIHLPATAGEPRVFEQARNAATTLANTLESLVPALKTVVQPTAEYVLSIDGITLPEPTRTVPFKANPGTHTVRIEAPGYSAQTRQVTLNEGETQTLSVVLTPLPTATLASLDPKSVALLRAHDSDARAGAELHDLAAAGRLRGYIGLGVGGGAFVLGTVTGVLSAIKTSDTRAHCDHDACQVSQRGALTSANTLANVANVAIPIGVLGIAYGLYELLTLPASPQPESRGGIAVDLTNSGITLGGSL